MVLLLAKIKNNVLCLYFKYMLFFLYGTTENLSSRDTPMRGHPVIRGHFLAAMSYLPHVKETVMKRHLSCRDT